jgi:hypothetical protein
MTKVVGIGGGKKTTCPWCGTSPACPDWTCPRVKAYEQDGESVVYVEFFKPGTWEPPTPPKAA